MSSISDADQLADRLDRVLPPHGQAVPEPTGEDPAVAIALRLAHGPHPVLEAEAVARIGAHLLAAVDSRPARHRVAFRPAMSVMRWAAAACLVLVIVIVSTATASARSLPGDTLYPVKRLVEQGQLALASDGGEVTLRLDLAGRRLDEFETLLKRGEVRPETLDDAAKQMNSTLALVEDGAGTPETVANQLIDLSVRQVHLAEEATTRVDGDPATAVELHEAVAEATAVEEAARQLVSPPEKPTVRAIPDRFGARSAPQNLGRDTAVFIPHDSAPAAATVDAPTAVYVEQAAPQSPPSAPVVYRPPVVVPTSTPPAVDPATPTSDNRPVADDPDETPVVDNPGNQTGNDLSTPTVDLPPTTDPSVTPTPDGRLVADDPNALPGDDLSTPTVDLPPTDPSVTPTPDNRLVVDDPNALLGDELTTPTPDLPPTDEPITPPDAPPADEANPPGESDLATPLPDLPPTGESLTLPTIEPESLTGDAPSMPAVELSPADDPGAPVLDDPAPALEAPSIIEPGSPPTDNPVVIPPDQPPAASGNGPSADVPPAVEAPVTVPQADPPQAGLSPAGDQAPGLGNALPADANGS